MGHHKDLNKISFLNWVGVQMKTNRTCSSWNYELFDKKIGVWEKGAEIQDVDLVQFLSSDHMGGVKWWRYHPKIWFLILHDQCKLNEFNILIIHANFGADEDMHNQWMLWGQMSHHMKRSWMLCDIDMYMQYWFTQWLHNDCWDNQITQLPQVLHKNHNCESINIEYW